MARYLITGGAGFLGFHLIQRLLKDGDKISSIDINEIPEEDLRQSVSHTIGDIRDKFVVQKALKGVEVVIHSAAALPSWSKKDIYSVNVDGTSVLLEESLGLGIKKAVFVSTSSVYGIPGGLPFSEDGELLPISHYGRSKVEAEKICLEYNTRGMKISIVRPPPIIGKGRLGVFQILFDWVKSGRRIPMIGKGNNKYQLVAAEDLVDAIFFLARSDNSNFSGAFNAGAERMGTIREDLWGLCNHAGSGARPISTPAFSVKAALRVFEILHLSPIHRGIYETADKNYVTSIEKIKNLGWLPKKSNAETLIETYDWYIENLQNIGLESGVGHRSPWDQKILSLFKKILK